MEEKGHKKNIWQAIRNEELEALLMRFSREEKQQWKTRSDFERFDFFCQNRVMILGSKAEDAAYGAWRSCFGDALAYPALWADRAYACFAWQRGNDLLGAACSEALDHHAAPTYRCDEKEYRKREKEAFGNIDEKCQIKSLLLTEDSVISHILKYGSKSMDELLLSMIPKGVQAVLFDAGNLVFQRPNPYHAQMALRKIVCGEICQEYEKSILYFQIVMSICEMKKRQKLQFDLVWLPRLSLPETSSFAEYLVLRRLCDGWIFTVWDEQDASRALNNRSLVGHREFSLSICPCRDERSTHAEGAARMLADVYPFGLLMDSAIKHQLVVRNTSAGTALPILLHLWDEWKERDAQR